MPRDLAEDRSEWSILKSSVELALDIWKFRTEELGSQLLQHCHAYLNQLIIFGA